MKTLQVNFNAMMDFVYSNPFIEALFFAILAIFVLKVFGFAFRGALYAASAIAVLILVYTAVTGGDLMGSVAGLIDMINGLISLCVDVFYKLLYAVQNKTSTI